MSENGVIFRPLTEIDWKARWLSTTGEFLARLWFDTMRNLLIISALFYIARARESYAVAALTGISLVALFVTLIAPALKKMKVRQANGRTLSTAFSILVSILVLAVAGVVMVLSTHVADAFLDLIRVLGERK
jgi:hypothetical protein